MKNGQHLKKNSKNYVDNNLSFQALIRFITEENLSKGIRKKHIAFWLFYKHLRNAIMHKDGISIADAKINLWGRDFELKKEVSFRANDFKADS